MGGGGNETFNLGLVDFRELDRPLCGASQQNSSGGCGEPRISWSKGKACPSFLDGKLRTEMISTLLKETHCMGGNSPWLTVIPTTTLKKGHGVTRGGVSLSPRGGPRLAYIWEYGMDLKERCSSLQAGWLFFFSTLVTRGQLLPWKEISTKKKLHEMRICIFDSKGMEECIVYREKAL